MDWVLEKVAVVLVAMSGSVQGEVRLPLEVQLRFIADAATVRRVAVSWFLPRTLVLLALPALFQLLLVPLKAGFRA